MITVALDLHTR